jgi:hypothetical protein
MTIQQAHTKIDNIAKESLNLEQKQIAKNILTKSAIDGEIDDKVFQFILPNIKMGFVFDNAPEVQQDNVAIIQENKQLGISNRERERESTS